MYIEQFFEPGLSHSSYLLGALNICAIIDPQRDIDIYTEAARRMGMEITHIMETHLHADFVSGHMDLRGKTGADIYAPESARCKFNHVPVREGSTFDIQNVHIRVIETPGHTPEHISYIVTDTSRGKDPVAIFCGDTLFVADAGRPDLFPGMAEKLAGKLFDSLKKLKKLPDFTEVYPAHGAGSLCGRTMGSKRSSTIGYEKRHNQPFKMTERKKFIHSLTNDMPAAPDHFARCSDINRDGPGKISQMSDLKILSPVEFRKLARNRNNIVVYGRDYDAFAGQHVPGSYNLDCGGKFSTFAGWVLPPDRKILLVADHPAQARNMAVMLRRVGLDSVIGYLDGSLFEWCKQGFETGHLGIISVPRIFDLIKRKKEIMFVDVRSHDEFQKDHIRGTVNIPAPDLRTRYVELNPEETIYLSCTTGHRSSLAGSILLQHGFTRLVNVAGGLTAVNALQKEKICRSCKKL